MHILVIRRAVISLLSSHLHLKQVADVQVILEYHFIISDPCGDAYYLYLYIYIATTAPSTTTRLFTSPRSSVCLISPGFTKTPLLPVPSHSNLYENG